MVKILAASDLHGDAQLSERLAKKALDNNVELVIIAGDLTIGDMPSPGLIAPFQMAGLKVLIIPGNHDSFNTLYDITLLYDKVKSLHANNHVHGEIGFFGSHGTQLGFIGSSNSEIEDILTKSHSDISGLKKRVMVVHEPPHGTKLDNIGFSIGNKGVRNAVEKLRPDLVICGHVHETFGLSDYMGPSKIINAGREGVIIDL